MKIENTKAQMRKGVLEYCILSILKDDDAYVAEILGTLKDAKMTSCRRHYISFAYTIKKRRITQLSLGRIYIRTTKKILWIN